MCGAATAPTSPRYISNGLSPRVRGSLKTGAWTIDIYRSIPTCAGQPEASDQGSHQETVYPHVCGAADSRMMSYNCVMGLSPRVRGSHHCREVVSEKLRSIPTCAGQPLADADLTETYRVYPHVCGAAVAVVSCHCYASGLSPRVRGSLSIVSPSTNEVGSIPTCAGQPNPMMLNQSATRVYPHVCGAAGLDANSPR